MRLRMRGDLRSRSVNNESPYFISVLWHFYYEVESTRMPINWQTWLWANMPPRGVMTPAISREARFLVPCHRQSRSQPAVVGLVPPCCPPLASCPNVSWVLVPITSGVFSAPSAHNPGAPCAPSTHGQVPLLPICSGMFLMDLVSSLERVSTC